MLIPLLPQEDEELSNSTNQEKTEGPIVVPLSDSVKPKDRVVKEKKAKKSAVGEAEKTLELVETINRIFKDEDCELITTQEQLLNFLRQQEVFGLDTETTGLLWYKDKIVGYSLGTATKSCYIPLTHKVGQNYQDDIDIMVEILNERSYYGFNAKFDWHFLESFHPGLRTLECKGEGSLALRCWDIKLPHSLKEVYKEAIDPSYEDYSFSKLFGGRAFDEFNPLDVYKYAAVDARKHYVVTEYFENKMRTERPEAFRRYQRIELRNMWATYNTEHYGICISREQIEKNWETQQKIAEESLASVKQISGSEDFNPGSPQQVKKAFEDLGFRLTTTNEPALVKIDHPLAKAILDYRGAIKLQGTYTRNLYEFCREEEGNLILHTNYNCMGADTGRMSSDRPNLQNLPRLNDYRAMFIARPGHTLVSVDYSQQEVRILAALARDETMINAFNSGKDFYAIMASIVFKLPYEQCTKKGVNGKKRNQMKSVVLGLNYDMSTYSLAEELGVSVPEANKMVDDFYSVCSKVKAYQKWTKDFAKANGYVETIFKHRRYFEGLGYKARNLNRFKIYGPGLKTLNITEEEILERLNSLKNNKYELKNFIEEMAAPADKASTKNQAIYISDRESVAWMEERQTTNTIIQGSGAEMTKLAAIVADNDSELKEYGAHIVNYVHDEIIIEVPDATAKQAGRRVCTIMNDVSEDMLDGLSGGCDSQFMKAWIKD
jgi:DNA polymerase I